MNMFHFENEAYQYNPDRPYLAHWFLVQAPSSDEAMERMHCYFVERGHEDIESRWIGKYHHNPYSFDLVAGHRLLSRSPLTQRPERFSEYGWCIFLMDSGEQYWQIGSPNYGGKGEIVDNEAESGYVLGGQYDSGEDDDSETCDCEDCLNEGQD